MWGVLNYLYSDMSRMEAFLRLRKAGVKVWSKATRPKVDSSGLVQLFGPSPSFVQSNLRKSRICLFQYSTRTLSFFILFRSTTFFLFTTLSYSKQLDIRITTREGEAELKQVYRSVNEYRKWLRIPIQLKKVILVVEVHNL